MRIRVEQLNPVVGDLTGNRNKIISSLKRAERDGVRLLILPELVTCGYAPMDLLERGAFLEEVYVSNRLITDATGAEQIASENENENRGDSGGTAIIFGTVTPNTGGRGRRIFNSAILADKGSILSVTNKTLLPTYDIFDEYRYFEPNTSFRLSHLDTLSIGITICEDIWNHQNEIVYHTYDVSPADELKRLGAKILVNISASPFTKRKYELREAMLRNHAIRGSIPIFYANQTGANTEVIFDGDSLIMSADGVVLERTASFKEDYADADLTDGRLHPVTRKQGRVMPPEEKLFSALVLGVGDYVKKTRFSEKVLIGLSGGIDSALTAAIAVEALGPENVTGVTMPSEFSSEGSVTDSLKLAENLGISVHQLSIISIYDTINTVLMPLFKDTGFGVAEENIQSRSRGILLMALSNKFGHMLLNTGNKSELAVGYCTLYGDMAGGLSVLSDVYKTEVYAISRWLNETWYKKEVIPESTIFKPPSAELRPDQKDSDSLPGYDILDHILKAYIEDQKSKRDIIEEGFDEETVAKVIRMVDLNEYKRRQAAPGLRVSAKAFGSGRRLPIVQRWTV
jgi:NAD+ synthase (glutamine-hydrolysing)